MWWITILLCFILHGFYSIFLTFLAFSSTFLFYFIFSWPPCVRRNARAITMVSSLVISSASSSARQFLFSPHFRIGLNPLGIDWRHQRWHVPPTKRRCCISKPLLRASVGETDIYNFFELEEEILEFMKNSAKPESFPSKKELVDAGRDDLVDAIVSQGGWLSLGWDLEEEEEELEQEIINKDDDSSGTLTTTMTTMVESDDLLPTIKSSCDEDDGDDEEEEEERNGSMVVSFRRYDDPQSVSSPGGSLEMPTAKQDNGIEGLLSRLEKQRNYAFEIDVRENEDHTIPTSCNTAEFDWKHSRFSTDAHKSLSSMDGLRNSEDHHEPQMWRSWNIQRAGLRDIDIEDIQIAPSEASNIGGSSMDNSKDEIIRVESRSADEPADRHEWNKLGSGIEKINHDRFIRSRLQQLELEASAVLRSVRSNIINEFATQKKLYDDWEFWEVQDNEISKAHDKLRSTRAKLAVLEGKMALAIIDARQIIDEKTKKIDDARRALRRVYSTCVVWPNSASSEVFLAGSFDGWATQRKMKKLSTGLFSVWLQLYPGQYEIKFIVDGEWRIDPQRPVVKSNGFENSLLIIS